MCKILQLETDINTVGVHKASFYFHFSKQLCNIYHNQVTSHNTIRILTEKEWAQAVLSQVTLNLCCGSLLSTYFCALPVMFGLTSCQCMLCSSSRSPQEKRCSPQQCCLKGRKRNSAGLRVCWYSERLVNSCLVSWLNVTMAWPTFTRGLVYIMIRKGVIHWLTCTKCVTNFILSFFFFFQDLISL